MEAPTSNVRFAVPGSRGTNPIVAKSMNETERMIQADALFAVAAKLLGLYLALQTLVYVGSALVFAITSDQVEQGVGPVVVQLLGALLSLGFAAILLFRTERLARMLRIPEVSGGIRIGSATALRTGIILLGLYVLVRGLGPFLQFASFFLRVAPFADPGLIARAAAELVPLIVALFMVLRPDVVIAMIRRGSPLKPDARSART